MTDELEPERVARDAPGASNGSDELRRRARPAYPTLADAPGQCDVDARSWRWIPAVLAVLIVAVGGTAVIARRVSSSPDATSSAPGHQPRGAPAEATARAAASPVGRSQPASSANNSVARSVAAEWRPRGPARAPLPGGRGVSASRPRQGARPVRVAPARSGGPFGEKPR